MSGGSSAKDLFALLEDDCAREILKYTSQKPMSATELGERCEASQATVYRRINRLKECSLLEERTSFRDRGRHYGIFVTTLDQITIEVEDGDFEVDIERRDDVADKFTDLWEGIHE